MNKIRALVTGLPRSRTYWFSRYLQAYGLPAVHEFLNGCHSKKEFYDAVGEGMINCDCGLYLTDWEDALPEVKCIVIHRPIAEVYSSLLSVCKAAGWPAPCRDQLRVIASKLRKMRGFHVDFKDIDDRLKDIHEYLGLPFDPDVSYRMAAVNLQSETYSFDNESYQLWVGG